jgi:ketosteroid isomerase-like protein
LERLKPAEQGIVDAEAHRGPSRIACLIAASLLAGSLRAGDRKLEDEFQAMAATERAFARACAIDGIRPSFHEYFAPDGIAFRPGPVNLREFQQGHPAPAAISSLLLEWEPSYGDISRSGDLGWLTGPTLLTDKSAKGDAPRYGYYSSVWKKQPDGSWRVALDHGISIPSRSGPISRGRTRLAPREGPPPTSGPLPDLQAAEEEMGRAAAEDLARAYGEWLAPSGRLHRDGHDPLTARSGIVEFLASQARSGSWETLHAETAKSGDLGYTYGKYELHSPASPPERGFYMRVWKLDHTGKWRLVLDVTNPLPPESS